MIGRTEFENLPNETSNMVSRAKRCDWSQVFSTMKPEMAYDTNDVVQMTTNATVDKKAMSRLRVRNWLIRTAKEGKLVQKYSEGRLLYAVKVSEKKRA